MVLKERPRTRRPGRRFVFGQAGCAAPLAHESGRTLLPSHWTARLDAEAIAEIREAERWLAELGGYCPMRSIFW